MPLTSDLRQSIDRIRDYLYGGGYPDPVSNAEQLSFLFFFYLNESVDSENASRAKFLKQSYSSMFAGDWTVKNPLNASGASIAAEQLKWSQWHNQSGEALVRFVRDEVFPFYEGVAGRSAVNFMKGARLSIDEPSVLKNIIELVDGLHLEREDADTKGDLFEYVLKQIKQAGELGQFRTPRHVIRAVVAMMNPQVGETIYDPAAGTAGFLIAAYNHIRLQNSSDAALEQREQDGKQVTIGHGDKLGRDKVAALQQHTFFGNDVDPKMVRLASMNLTLRGLPQVNIQLRNVLTTTQDDETRERLGIPTDGFKVVLANPPFSGKVDKDRIVDDVKVGNTTATEILFLKYMLDSLRDGGRCGVVVPEGVLFGSTSAHKELRRQLLENNQVQAVLSLPGGVFQPYSGVKTSVLLFAKGGRTEQVQFLHADNDGYKLDANHDTPIEADDLPALIAAYEQRAALWQDWQQRDKEAEWTEKWWFADVGEIRSNDFNLSAGRYRPLSRAKVDHRPVRELLDELRAIEQEILEEVDELAEKLTAENAG